MPIVLVSDRKLRDAALSLSWGRGLALFLLVASPWFVWMWMTFGDYFFRAYVLLGNLHYFTQPTSFSTRTTSLHEHNERARAGELVARMQGGESIVLVSDAGTPLVSDPGYLLVAAAVAAGIVVTPVPGPNAAIAALSASGLPCDRFCFDGGIALKARNSSAANTWLEPSLL